MLAEILRQAQSGRTLSVSDIARELKVSPDMAEAMCLELVHQGYLAAASFDCAAGCAACGAGSACRAMRAPRLWALTGKGARALARLRGQESAL